MTDPTFHIATPRLTLSYFIPSNPAHCTFLYDLYNTPLFISTEGKTGITSAAIAKERLETRFIDEHKRNGYGTYLVSPKDPGSLGAAKPIGSVSLMRGDMLVPDIGFAIVPEENGKGYATEAAGALIDYAKGELGVEGVFGFGDPENAGSRRVMEKLGMEDRGVRKVAAFGGRETQVFVTKEMGRDLAEYNLL